MINSEFNNIFKNKITYFAIISVFIVLLFGSVYKSPVSGKDYNLVQVFFEKGKNEELVNTEFLSYEELAIHGPGGYLGMFAPIIAAMPFIFMISVEKKIQMLDFR